MNRPAAPARDFFTPPAQFLWGVATSAYQSEGGYNGKNQPQTNWAAWEVLGYVMRTGDASGFYSGFLRDFELCRQMGLNAFRLSVEWSRVQPTHVNYRSAPPAFDHQALERYAEMLAACRYAGLEPLVTLHHFVHPAWLGTDAWLREQTPHLFASYARETVRRLNTLLADRHHLPPVTLYVTLNEPNTLLINTYLSRLFPTRTLGGTRRLLRAAGNLLAAHVLAYNAIHDVHAEEGWPAPAVTVNNYCTDLYWSDFVLLDLLAMRERGVNERRLQEYIHHGAETFEASLNRAPRRLARGLLPQVGELLRRFMMKRGFTAFDTQLLGPFLREVERSPRDRFLDYLALDYYDPFTAHLIRTPSFGDLELANRSFSAKLMSSVTSKWWDWHVLPEGLGLFCRHYSDAFEGRPVLIAENGMALRKKPNNQPSRRRDRVTRSEFLRAHVGEVIHMAESGVPVFGYMHWSLFDNYEWGTYTPRFGLFTLDYTRGMDRIPEDHLGDRPSETYAQLVADARRQMGR